MNKQWTVLDEKSTNEGKAIRGALRVRRPKRYWKIRKISKHLVEIKQ